jgi:hypothetical protein
MSLRAVHSECKHEAKNFSQWSIIEWVTKIYYPLRASEGTLSRWSRLHFSRYRLQFSRVDVRQPAGRKNNCRIFITT